jgi:hypothetical protein
LNPRLVLLCSVVVVLSWLSCGGAGVEGVVRPTGGEICLADERVCISVPPGALEQEEILRITPASDVPAAALSEGFDISSTSGRKVTFLKPATVRFALELVDAGGIENENILRIYTRGEGDWQPLDDSFVDRVRGVVLGGTLHLSPFVVLRSDRLPDGGLPIELDGGMRDSGVIVIPPFDAGRPDAGRPDAGTPDAGPPDAGPPDAGMPDAGPPDAGPPDAGPPDAGPPDAGPPDAGPPDAGEPDAGEPDAGEPDAGEPDAGEPDAGEPDAGEPDAGVDAGEPDAGDGG